MSLQDEIAAVHAAIRELKGLASTSDIYGDDEVRERARKRLPAMKAVLARLEAAPGDVPELIRKGQARAAKPTEADKAWADEIIRNRHPATGNTAERANTVIAAVAEELGWHWVIRPSLWRHHIAAALSAERAEAIERCARITDKKANDALLDGEFAMNYEFAEAAKEIRSLASAAPRLKDKTP